MRRIATAASIFLMATIACVTAESPRGFSLPEGDPERGEVVFVDLSCHSCHEVEGVTLPESAAGRMENPIMLGGETSRVKTYGELVTSIINPSHRLAGGYPQSDIADQGESRMTNYNDVLTVSQLTDLVMFLESKYVLEPYQPTDYPVLP